ncbi:MAG: asparagine synthase (glutamine-hydrolyzing) [Acidobacteriota bacterium]
MCGIAGLSLKHPVADGALEAMAETMRHRGPDGKGFFRDGPVGLAHRRLAIIDVDGGAQPITNEDGTVVVVFNGEIYNFKSLREELAGKGHRFRTRSDTEVLCHLYEEEGPGFPSRLNGIFAFALYDRSRRTLLLARDPLGVKPLYWARCGDGVLFASEIKAIQAYEGFDRRADLEALTAFLTCEYIPAPRSAYAAVRKLLPGYILEVKDGEAASRPYWRWTVPESPIRSRREAVEMLRETVFDAVRDQLVSDVPLGVFLSGGVDSSIVTSCMKQAGGDVQSFSISFEDPTFDESAYARRAAEHIGSRHHEHRFTETELLTEVPRVMERLDEPFADPSIFPTALLSRFARERVTVALGGDGGDELFAGYPTYLAHRYYGLYKAVPGFVRRPLLGAVARLLPVSHKNLPGPYLLNKFRDGAESPMPQRHHLWLGAFTPSQLGELIPGYRSAFGFISEWIQPPPRRDAVSNAQWHDLHTYLLEDILAKVDRASMMASLEARVPLLDPRVVRLAFSFPPEWKLRGTQGKAIFKQAFADRFPPGFLDRKKKGFGIPMARWLVGPLRPFVEDLLSDQVLGGVPFLSPDLPRRLWREHLEMKADHRKPLWVLLCLLDWWRREAPCV